MTRNGPYLFDEFFASGKEESISPFLTPKSRKYAKNIALKSALLSAFLLALAFGLSFYSSIYSNFTLVFVYVLVGTPALIGTIDDIRNLEINIDVLMTLAAFLSVLIGSQLEGALLLVLFALSGAMESAVSSRAKGALHHLHEITPHFATVVDDKGVTTQKSVREIPVGTHVLVKAGEIVPLDGEVISGRSSLNLVHLTGESHPIPKEVGDTVQAGSRNLDGSITLRITKSSSESTLSRIVKLIHDAQEAKPKLERLFDRFSKVYSMSIILLSALFALSFPFLFHIPFLGVEGSLYRALAFLIAASPCALIIATPTAYLSALSASAKKGVLLKGGVQLDSLAGCDTIVFDKTGTLTTGELTLKGVTPPPGSKISSDQALALAAALEKRVTHPISAAIQKAAADLPAQSVQNFRAHAGLGLSGTSNGTPLYIGNRPFIEERTKLPEIHPKEGELIAYFLIGDELFLLSFEDELRDDIGETLNQLKSNYQVIMLTGDHYDNAAHIAKTLGIDNFQADLRPDKKLDIIAELAKNHQIAMCGDGINDAPALARAHVGIAMGKVGSDTAIDASDIVILNDDLNLIAWLSWKAKQTMRIVRENLILALAVITLATTPALLGFIPLWLAVILHEGGTVVVGLNSLRLLKK